jgi:hypothetical protein
MDSTKRTARIAGILYLLVGIFGGFSEGFVDPKMYVANNALTTAGNVIANPWLVRMSVVAHLLDGTFFVFVAMVLYNLTSACKQERSENYANTGCTCHRHYLFKCSIPV